MYRKKGLSLFVLILILSASLVSGCGALVRPVSVTGSAPTPVVVFEPAGTDNPDVFVDPAGFEQALIQAIAAHDIQKLEMWMAEPFLTAGWRADGSDSGPADAINEMYANYIGANTKLEVVKGADLKALMGGKDPLSISRPEAGVVEAALVSGWGMDGRDEAVFFIAREANNSLKWQGWMVVPGGFSGTRMGGAQMYQNDQHGFRVYLPKGATVSEPQEDHIAIVMPETGGGHPGMAFIDIEPANGRTTQEAADAVVNEVKAQLGPGNSIGPYTALIMEDALALAANHLPGQDLNTQVFMVHGDTLYRMMFTPDNVEAGDAYWQAQDLYAMVMNTFHFTK